MSGTGHGHGRGRGGLYLAREDDRTGPGPEWGDGRRAGAGGCGAAPTPLDGRGGEVAGDDHDYDDYDDGHDQDGNGGREGRGGRSGHDGPVGHDGPGGTGGPGGPGGPGGLSGLGGLGGLGGEDELRQLLQTRVGELEPAPDALEHLRRAVPARRRRRRHAVVGAAAALLLGGTSIPAMVHVANLNDGPDDRAANTASSQNAQGGAQGAHGEGTESAGPQPTGGDGAQPGADRPTDQGATHDKDGPAQSGGVGSPEPGSTMDVSSPACGREQLGQGAGSVGQPDAEGRVYGAFRVVNTSATSCSIEGGGTVGLVAQGTTSAERVHVVDHTSGDEATGLPDPGTTPDRLILKPGDAYEVKFAWIPDRDGGANGCVKPGPTTSPEPSKDPPNSSDGAGATAGGGGGQGDDGGGGDGGSQGGAVVLSHTPESGEPVIADTKIADACAGTVYRTEALSTG